jgi:hypothetical protein
VREREGMDREAIPDDIKRFILTCITSVPFLEALLLLRASPDEDWNSARVARRLYLADKAAAELLAELHAAHLTSISPQDATLFRYNPNSNELRQMIDRLADTYSKHLVAVANLIHSKTSKKAQRFADAFKLRKDT